MNMLSGIYKPDSGEIFINGVPAKIDSPEDSKKYGIGMVHQHFKLVENFSAADNIWIGEEKENDFFLRNERSDKIREISKKFGFEIDPLKLVHEMSVSEKQTVEIIKVLFYGADLLILDEPTAVLTLQETRKLFKVLRKMSKAGCSIIIITHKLNEVLEISDRVTILRKGKSIGTIETKDTNASELTNMMVGHQVELSIDRPECETGPDVLEVENLSIINDEGVKAIDQVSFKLKSGEILGVAGVSGCGQKELCEAIAGLQKIESGSILYKGEHIEDKSPRKSSGVE
jgi:simple sugar transport system ATP-binding protein